MVGGNVCYLLEIWRIAFVWEHVIERIVVKVSSSQFIGSCYVGRPRVGLLNGPKFPHTMIVAPFSSGVQMQSDY